MNRVVFVVTVVTGLACTSPARAQFCSVGPAGFGGVGFGRGVGFSFHHRGVRVAGFAGGFYSRSVFVAPVAPVFPPIAQLTPFGFGPGFLQPGWGVGPRFGWNPVWGGAWGWWGPPPFVGPPFGWGWGGWGPPPFVAPPVVVLPPFVLGANEPQGPNAVAGAGPREPEPEPGPTGAKPGDFVVIAPKRELPPAGEISPEVVRVAAVVPARQAFAFDPFAKPILANVEKRDPDPAKEAARLLELGREAFETAEYGKAIEFFGRAVTAIPKAAEPHFLKAQGWFAAGEYADSVAAIRAGLALDPAWPAGAFDPKEPYGANAAEFAAHLAQLRKTVAANSGEPTLEFLLGYQSWFLGDRVEAAKWFVTAAKTLPAPGPIALFK